MTELNRHLGTIAGETRESLVQLRTTLERVEAVVSPDSPVLAQIEETLQDLSAVSQSVRRLAERLDRDPSLLLRGRAPASEP